MSSLRAAAAAAAAIAAVGIGAGAAKADTYCVGKSGCDGPHTFISLQTALDTAAANAGDDRVEIGTGSFVQAKGFHYTGTAANRVEIAGAGADLTHLGDSTEGTGATLFVSNGNVHDLELVGPVGTLATDRPLALDLLDADAHDVKTTGGYTGARLGHDATLRDSAVSDTGYNVSCAGVEFIGAGGVLENTTVDTGTALAVDAQGAGVTARITRSRLHGGYGLSVADAASVTVDDSLMTGLAFVGIWAKSASSDTDVTLVNDTLVGEGGSTAIVAMSTGAGHFTTVSADNVALVGFHTSLEREAFAGGAFIAVSHSAFDAATDVGSGFGSTDISDANIGAPTGLDSDYRPQAGSPLIDAGRTNPANGLPASDLAGANRAIDGDGNGSALPDIGAFEYVPPVPPVPAGSGTPSAPAPPAGTPQPPAPLVFSPVTFAPKRFATRRPLHAARRGTRIRFTLSGDARVRVSLRRGHRRAGSITLRGRRGSDSIRFSGKVGRHALKPGRYVARAVATDASGRRSAKRAARFTVVR